MTNFKYGYSKHKHVYTIEQKTTLMDYIIHMSNIYFGLTPNNIRVLIYDCAVFFKIAMPSFWEAHKKAGLVVL